MTELTITQKKRGPKPKGEVPMTGAQRQQRRREQMRATGTKSFLLEVTGLHLQYVEALAHAEGVSAAAALRHLLDPTLDRFVGVMVRAERMAANGATEEECAQFIHAHLHPALPPIQPERTDET